MIISNSKQGLLFGFMAYSMWGVFPLFFHLLRTVPSTEVLYHRVIWSFVFVILIMLIMRRTGRLIKAFKTPDVIKALLISSLLVSANWLIFIWAVAQGRVLETSLGYFLTPLVSVFLARIILKEQLNGLRKGAIVVAVTGILWLLLRIGYMPWVSLLLAITFGLYGLVRKQVDIDTLTGLGVETALLLPLAVAYGLYLVAIDQSHFLNNDTLSGLLICSGVVTALPLLLFASAAKKLSLSALGFMMYINPTLQFLVAVFVLSETINTDQLIGFCFIWCALLMFSLGSLRQQQKSVISDQRSTEV